MGYQEPDDEDGNNQDIIPIQRPQSSIQAPIQATPINTISPSGHLLALPSSIREPIDMDSSTVLIDGRQILVSEL